MVLNPKSLGTPYMFWEFFIEIAGIPRCSGHEEAIRSYLIEKAKFMNYNTKVDKAGNLLVFPPKLQNDPNKKIIILQSHMDIVCEKNKDSSHDFSKDPLNLERITEERSEWITAKGTTLGADNGVGLAFSLAFMFKISNENLSYPDTSVQFLFTVEEETARPFIP